MQGLMLQIRSCITSNRLEVAFPAIRSGGTAFVKCLGHRMKRKKLRTFRWVSVLEWRKGKRISHTSVNKLDQCFPTFFSSRPTFNASFIVRPTMRYDQTNGKQINEKRNNVYTCNLLLMRNLSLHIGYYQIKSRLDWRQAHTQRSIKSVRFQAVPSVGFSYSYS